MEKILIFIKHNVKFVWKFIEWVNGRCFSILYSKRKNKVLLAIFDEFSVQPYSTRELNKADADSLYTLIQSQKAESLKYFSPHEFDRKTIAKIFSNPALMKMGVFHKEELVGYFFLRFFVNRKCFVGRLIDEKYRGKGIGSIMNNIIYETAWRMDFRCLSTISKSNKAVIKAHSKNKSMKILKELPNKYLLVEFINLNK